MTSPLGGAVSPGGGGGSITEAQLRTAAAALAADLDVNAVEITNLGNPTTDSSATHRGYVLGQATHLIYDHGGTAGNRVYTSLAAAVSAAANIDGLVRIWIKATSGIPTTASGTYALANRIELCGLSGGSPGTKVTLQIVTGTVLQNPCAFRNLELEHDLSAAWITSTGNLSVVFDNTAFNDNGATADICTLSAASSNSVTFDNGSIFSIGGAWHFATLASGQTLDIYCRDGSIGENFVAGSAGGINIHEFGGLLGCPSQVDFSGVVGAHVQGVQVQLAHAVGDISFNDVGILDVAAPTLATSAATRGFVDGTGSVSVSSSSVSLSEANVATGHVSLTGTLSADSTVTMPTGTRSCVFTNSTSGTYTLKIAGYSSGSCYLAPGQTRRVVHVAGVLRGEALRVVEYETTVDLSSGYTVGDHDTVLLKIPAAFDVDRVEIRCTSSVGTGNAAVSVGVSGSYNQLVLSTAIATAGDVVGLATAEAGADFTDKISAHYSTAQTLTLRVTVTTATLTAGALRVMVVGRYVGE